MPKLQHPRNAPIIEGMIDSPIFLVGSERSGTTLLRLMIDSHPDIAFGEEFEYSVEHIDAAGKHPELQQYYQDLEKNRIFATSGFEIDKSLSYPELVNSFLETRQQAKQAKHVGATIHFGFLKALQLWPNARFIHMVRDPRDVAHSILKMGWEQEVWFALNKWIEAETDWEEFVPSLAPEQHMTIKFTDLIFDHKSQLKRVCEFIGTDYTRKMMSYAAETDYETPDAGLIRRWPATLSTSEIQQIEARIGPMMLARDFELSEHPKITINETDIKKLAIKNKLKKTRYGMKKYGTLLYLQYRIAKQLPLPGLNVTLQNKINEKDKQYLKKSWRGEIGDHRFAR